MKDMTRSDVQSATHVELLDGTIKKIASKWGIDEHGHLAKPSAGGFGVVTDDGERVEMMSAKSYWQEMSLTTTNYTKDDDIEVTCEGRTVEGKVILASANGISLMIGFEAMFGGHVGMMPITMLDQHNGYSIIDGTKVSIRKTKVLQ